MMNSVFKSILLLCSLLFISACATLINPSLKRRAVISVKLEKQSFIELEKTNCFEVKLSSVLNNGRIIHDWDDFKIAVYNCSFSEGVIYFDRNFVSIKVSNTLTNVSDSIGVEIPLLTKIEIKQLSNSSLKNSFEIPFVVNAIYSTGIAIEINNKNKFDNFWENYIVKVEGKPIDFPYSFNISNLDSFKNTFSVKCQHQTIPFLKDSAIIPIKYDGHYPFFFKGNNGHNGQDGNDSYRRHNNNNGYPGQNGQNGQNGAAGSRVYLLFKSFLVDSVLYIKAIAHSGYQVSTCIFNPELGHLTVTNSGGDGGNGGEVGEGADGSNKTEKEAAGNGGDGGDGGRGGQIKVFADSVASLYFGKITLLNVGGKGGSAGRGGKNGANGSDDKLSFGLSLIAKTLNSLVSGRGQKGMMGVNGEYGLETTFETISLKRLEQMEQNIRNN